MNTRQALITESLRQCAQVLDSQEFRIPEVGPHRVKLHKALAEIAALSRTQHIERRSVDGSQKKTLREQIRVRLRRISSHALVVLEGLPGLKDSLRLPHANAKDAELLDATTRIVKNVRTHLRALQKAGLRKDSIPQLEKLTRALVAKTESFDTAIARRSRATDALPDVIRRGRKIAHAVDAIIIVELAGDPPALSRWVGAMRIPAKMGRPRKKRRRPPPA